MYLDLLEIVKCPKCNGNFKINNITKEEDNEILDGEIFCNCGEKYSIKDGVLDFNSKEQESMNQWSESYKELNYNELDKKIEENTDVIISDLNNKLKKYIIDDLNCSMPEVVLDIASGRGMLARYMAANINYNPTIILTDLSFEVLKYDRIKLKNINSSLKVNFIACDCLNLPLKDKTIDRCVSFFGICNMIGIQLEGIKECKRVLKQSGKLINSTIIEEDNENIKSKINDALKLCDLDSIGEMVFEKDVYNIHKNGGFDNVKLVTIGEGICNENKFDLIPLINEWYAVIAIEAK